MLSFHFTVLLSVGVATIAARPSNLFPLRHRQASTSPYASPKSTSTLLETEFGQIVDVEINIGGQDILVLVDLGSSDLWVVETGYQCIDRASNLVIPQSNCTYGNDTYNASSTFKRIPDQNFGVFYGAGIASGIVGYENITIAGINVPNQEFGVVKSTTNAGDGVNIGLMGLAYPALTSAHPGERESYDNTSFLYHRIPYTPLVWSMAELGLIEPYFSLAIERRPLTEASGPGGFLAFGEVAPVSHSSNWASTPVVTLPQLPTNVTGNKTQLAYWALEVKSVTYGPGSTENATYGSSKTSIPKSCLTTNATSFNSILDNGNPLTFLPSHLAESVNSAFSPAATPPGGGEYLFSVECNATTPVFGVEIGNQTFWHDPRDMIYYVGEGTCISAIARAEDVSLQGISSPFLGMQFFKNVLAIFDFGVDEMRFAARE